MDHRSIRPLAAAFGAALGLTLVAAAAPGCTKSRSRGGGGGGRTTGTTTSSVDLVFAEQRNAVEATCACRWASEGYSSEADCVASSDVAGEDYVACSREAYARNPDALRPYMECLRSELSSAAACIGSSDCSDAALLDCYPGEDVCNTDDPVFQAFEDEVDACASGDDTSPPVSSGSCPEIVIGSATGTGATTGSTEGYAADSAGSCGGADAPDVSVQWTVPSTGTWVIDTAGSGFDTLLYVTDGCGGAELACDDDGAGSLQSRVEVEATAGQSLVIVVDGFGSGDAGAFVLNIQPAP